MRFKPQVVILAGGRGTRLGSLTDNKQKVALDVGGKPLITKCIEGLHSVGLYDIILAVGYRSGDVIEATKHFDDIFYSIEKEPLGTAGAIRNVKPYLRTNPILVMNGDTIYNGHLEDFINNYTPPATILISRLSEPSERFGNITLDRDGKISFIEKKFGDLVSAGIYLLSQEFIESIPDGFVSIEHDVFQRNHNLYGHIGSDFIDIGTKESYQLV